MGYGDAPWTFKGRAWYQLSLVRSEEARRHVPASLPLVELFGWTLGGFYLARYEDSPVGAFDELVALGGLVWDAPVSAAWAARVYVSNPEARRHGLRHVGLPSRLATFTVVEDDEGEEGERASTSSSCSWWRPPAPLAAAISSKAKPRSVTVEVCNAERPGSGRALSAPVCRLRLPPVRAGSLAGTLGAAFQQQQQQQARGGGALKSPSSSPLADGPSIRLALPSFSGATQDVPALLKYACALTTNVLPAPVARVEFPGRVVGGQGDEEEEDEKRRQGEAMDLVLGGRPLVALCFNNMEMRVDEPETLVLPTAGQEHQQQTQQQQQGGRRGLLWGRRRRGREVEEVAAAALA